ncbi:DUF4352 domain-containing protein [Streptococcus ratti]|uniref:DUF4352 domain-containing protein n=1 Tax=Streptococcus ratti FA-1 = DSM 20564 TaxID=699248 RepID=A0ABN0GUX8_STRRT|nr:DUF4352 domain-containing protein [Streptococcus ratti]EJN93610.1 hypothetical protein SRA_03711 [Streptococcus ratti FA-1 = DSM 20564]EMP69758.1 hypothetical protein D822_06708 [Streptococcus ratti FA-1 = DSM 20564]QEY07478.1 DUF4352 domain-containing protein [Streptococcus ratti]VEI59929.1 Telomeric repeat-binding factor 2 [Streptococcus mutans]
MEKRTNVWKILSIVFMSVTGFFFLLTLVMSAFYIVSRQDFNHWTATNNMQDRTIANKKKEIKRLKLEDEIRNGNRSYDDSYDKAKQYIFGESAKLDTGEEVTVTGIKTASNLKIKGASSDDQKIVLTVSVKNTTMNTIQFSPRDFYIYDSALDIADLSNYAGNEKIPDTIKPGETIDVKIYFTISESSPYIVNFGNAYWIPQSAYQKKSRSV